ncbi:ankyrin repeat domain-containing protein 27-like isoform X2 [Neocloeon triangulifer]|uniref:ankyrin repeat domain-containing protein 27-like isoform X2 n=1 Tax=Neocloeon triangulifer TaxID=2078957 RepID=UPI00286F63C2|nr:ankyrin repeat domain-containing protein 27-like isoform X2 [Neocloeon triangulifer]
MECAYDEDLNENAFFQVLQADHQELFQKATLEGWVICVPRSGALPKYPLTDEDFLSHILIPSDELPESHFCSLLDRQVKVLDRMITAEGDDGRTFSTNILFEETCYTDELYKYKVLCLESLLEQHSCSGHAISNPLISLGSLRDCIDFLWTESSGQPVLEKLDESIEGFLTSQPDLEEEPLQTQIDLAKGLYEHCLRNTLKDQRLQEQVRNNRHLMQNVRIAVETYVQHGIYKILIKGIVAATASEDAKLNKVIRNSVELQLKDLDVRSELFEKIPAAKQEVAKIDGFSTVLGKIGCIQKALGILSGNPANQAVSADDFLPILIFLVVKVSLPNWLAHLTMMRDFNFSDLDENLNSFLVTSLEAAIEHVRSGRLFEPLYPEAQGEEKVKLEMENLEKNVTEYLFRNIQVDNMAKVQDLLAPSSLLDEFTTEDMCHPLCTCEKCECELSRQKSSLSVGLSSTNEKGLTALHVACRHGRLEIAEFLLEIGAQVTAKDLQGNTPLHYAAIGGHQHLLLLLLNSKASPNSMNNNGNTPLHFAAQNGHETCLKALIYFCEHVGRPINVNWPNSNGDIPLHHAAKWGYEGIAQILLEAGSRPDLKNNRKVSPMDLAHSVHISKLLSTVNKPTGGGFRKRLSFIKMKIAAASKLRLDLMDLSPSGSSLSSPSRSRENLLEYGTKPTSVQQSKKENFLLSGGKAVASYLGGRRALSLLPPWN